MDDKLESFVLEAILPSPETSPTIATTFITESMDEINGKETAVMLANQSKVHALTGDVSDANTWFTTSTFHTTFGNITQQEGHNMAKLLANQTVQHTLCHTPFDNG